MGTRGTSEQGTTTRTKEQGGTGGKVKQREKGVTVETGKQGKQGTTRGSRGKGE